MDKQEFNRKLAQVLEVEQVNSSDVLKDFEQWDSLAVLSVLAMVDSQYGVTIPADEIRAVATADDLATLVESKQKAVKTS
jgi:acyl carrier protein